MASCDSSSPTDGAKPVDSTPPDASLSLPTSSQDSEEGRRTKAADVSDIPSGDGQKPAAGGVGSFAAEIQAMKMKLHELERQAQTKSVVGEEEASHPQLMDDLEEYRRIEACLKNHRKEWEREHEGMDSGIYDLHPRYHLRHVRHGLANPRGWKVSWDYRNVPELPTYKLPSLVELSRKAAEGYHEGDDDTYDEFDAIIDYGSRRDRLRKNFEWEMDRIYLAEEMDRRRKQKIEEAKAAAQSPKDAAPPLPEFAQAQLNRIDWSGFKRLAGAKEKDAFVVDVLVGEPNIDDDLRYWFGFSGRVRKRNINVDLKTLASMPPWQSQLPERVRIHSEALTRILGTILGKGMGGSTVVFTRPFKALAHCEQALRDWCTAVEKKIEALPETNKDALIAANGSASGPPEDGAALQEAGKREGQVPANLSDAPEKPTSAGKEPFKERGGDSDSEDEDDQVEDPDDVTISPAALEHLKCLLSFLDSYILARQAYLKSPDCRKVFFSDLWHLFRPGMEVTGIDGKQAYRVIDVTSAKHRVAPPWERWSSITEKRKKTRPFSITCLYIDFDGTNMGPVPKVFDFKRFDGERDVTSLEVYPLRFHPTKRADFGDSEWNELEALPANERYRQKLIRRGAKFLQVAGVKHMYYAGPTLEARDEVESQVVVDFETAFSVEDPIQKLWKPELKTMVGNPEPEEDGDQDQPDESCVEACCENDIVHDDSYVELKQREDYINGLLPEADAVDEQPSIAIIPRPLKELRTSSGSSLVSDDELIIMSYRVFGFVLRSRKWAKLDVSHLTDVHLPAAGKDKNQQGGPAVVPNSTAFDRLVLEEWHRPTILALIAQHFRDKKSTVGQREEFDIVKGKGKGLILLLHGAPGVGKTSTAEGVAEMFKKPLFQITCGDLGTTAQEVEKALETNFALANRWDCILLLDEADVFLAERTKLDFKRNGLVAVFLRVMEYYAGVLFLTTNRIGDFDEAFTSRIHLSLYYPELNGDKTVKVFKLNMSMIRERFANKGRYIEIDEMGIGGFAAQHFTAYPQARWNGRQIRNACQTALALAEFEAQGNSHQDILRPDAVVKLGVAQFEIVRNAYLEFSKYMHNLYGSTSARRAKEAKVRAIWVDENNNVVPDPGTGGAGMEKRAFGAASKVQQQHWQPPPPPPAQEQRYGYHHVGPTQSGYTDANRMPQAQADPFPPSGPSWDTKGARTASANNNPNVNANAPYQGSWEGQADMLAMRQQPSVGGQRYETQQQQQQQQAYPPGFDRGIQEMYTASGAQAAGQLPPGSLPPSSGNPYAPGAAFPGQQWRGTPGPRQ